VPDDDAVAQPLALLDEGLDVGGEVLVAALALVRARAVVAQVLQSG